MSRWLRKTPVLIAASAAVAVAIPAVAVAEPVAPTVQITSSPAALSDDSAPVFDFVTSEVTTVECSLVVASAEPVFEACASPYQADTLADGDWVFTVSVTDALGATASDSYAFTVDTATAAPALTAEAVGPSHVLLSWPAVEDGAGPVTYDVLLGDTILAGGITETSYEDRWAAPGAELTYGVRAIDELGNVSELATAVVSTPAATVPGEPEDISVAGDGRRITVTWTAPTDTGGTWLDDYKVTLTEQGSGVVFTRYAHRLKTSVTFSGLRKGRTYRAAVSAANSAGSGPAAVSVWLQLAYTPPAAPQVGEAASGSPRDRTASVAVSWEAPDTSDGVPVSGYRVTVVSDSGRRRVTWVGSSARVAEVSWLSSGVAYRCYVQAYNRAGLSAPSEWSNVVPAR